MASKSLFLNNTTAETSSVFHMCVLCFPSLNGELYDGLDQVFVTMYLWNLESALHII